MEQTEIETKLNSFADEMEAEYLAEYNKRVNDGEKDVSKTYISGIYAYDKIILRMKQGLMMSIEDIYIVDSVNNGNHEIKIYKEVLDEETGEQKRVLMANVQVEAGKEVVVFEGEYAKLNNSVADKELKNILSENEKNKEADLKQTSKENNKKEELKPEEVKKLKEESATPEEYEAKRNLSIKPGTAQELISTETREFPEFRGKNVKFGYSKSEPGYIAYDEKTGEKILGPAVEYNRTITKQSPDGEITTERHSAMMQSTTNPNKMITIQVGAYGDRIFNETDRTSEGDWVSRTIEVRGKTIANGKQIRDAMNNKETRENMGETADDLVQMGVTTKKNPEWKISAPELEEFKDQMRAQMGPCTEDELIKRFQKAAKELSEDERTLKRIVEQAKAAYIEEQKKYADRIRNGEGRGFGERAEDPRRES